MENPEERTFNTDPVAAVLAERGRYVAAVLTIARAYITDGRPGRLPSLPSYDGWSNLVRSALVWLGGEDPVSTIATGRAEDPQRQNRGAVFSAWAAELDLHPARFSTSELIGWAEETEYGGERRRPQLHAALLDVAPSRHGSGIDPKRLGRWLLRSTNSISAGYKLTVVAAMQPGPAGCSQRRQRDRPVVMWVLWVLWVSLLLFFTCVFLSPV